MLEVFPASLMYVGQNALTVTVATENVSDENGVKFAHFPFSPKKFATISIHLVLQCGSKIISVNGRDF